MTEDEAMACLGVLIGTTPGPWPDSAIEQWIEAFMRVDQPSTLRIVCQRAAERYVGQYRISLGEIMTTYHDQVRFKRVRALPSGIAHCDGSGWIGSADGLRPCARCNPAIARVFAESSDLDRYRDGVPLHELGVGVERTRGGKMRHEHGDPPQCQPAHDDGLMVVSREVGWQVARDAYISECVAAGREPKLAHFDQMVGAGRG